MRKRFLLAMLALAGLTVPGATTPVWAMTSSANCVAALKKANAKHAAGLVPSDCWRMAYINLGMKQVLAEGVLGAPDGMRDAALNYRGRKFAFHETLYVYPRNLKNWLRLAPQALDDFHPTVLHVIYWKEQVVAMSLSDEARIDAPPCTPSHAVKTFRRTGADFPFDFHGIGLKAKMAAVPARFGRFAAINRSQDFANYWPVPLAFGGEDQVQEISFATGMAFAAAPGMPHVQVRRDPATCLVTGYTLSAP